MEKGFVLIDAARHGDRTALERLLAESQPDIRRYAQTQCAGTSEADDAVQETPGLSISALAPLGL